MLVVHKSNLRSIKPVAIMNLETLKIAGFSTGPIKNETLVFNNKQFKLVSDGHNWFYLTNELDEWLESNLSQLKVEKDDTLFISSQTTSD